MMTAPILIVAPAPPPYGGMALQAQALLEQIGRGGAKVDFLATNPELPAPWSRIVIVRTLMQSLRFLWQLAHKVMAARVVHVLAASYWYFLLRVVPTVVLSKLLGRRVILNYRGGEAPKFFARCKWLVVPLLRMVDEIAVPSSYLERTFAEYGFPAVVIPNFVDLRRFRFRQRRLVKPRLLVNRSLEPLYNVGMAIEAHALIKAKYPDASLDVVGGGSEAAKLQRWVESRGIAGVRFHGAVPNAEIARYLDTADILLNPTNADNMPISLLEAFAAGVPVVTTNVGGIQDLVGPAEAALLVDAGDAVAMAGRIEELLRDPETVASMTQRAYQMCAQMSWDRIGGLWMDLYDNESVGRGAQSAGTLR